MGVLAAQIRVKGGSSETGLAFGMPYENVVIWLVSTGHFHPLSLWSHLGTDFVDDGS